MGNPTNAPVPNPTNVPVPDLTSRPYIAPSQTPARPTERPFNPCTNGEMELEIKIHTDSKPQEIEWFLNQRRGQTIDSKQGYSGKHTDYVHKYCVAEEQIYEFHLHDIGGDGIQSEENGNGYYTISVNGEVYSEGGNFENEEVDYIQGKCQNVNESRLQFILKTGVSPQDVSWTLSKESGDALYNGGPWEMFAGQSLHFFSNICLPADECFTLTLKSSSGNGLNNGHYEINWDQANVAFGNFSDGPREANNFGNCQTHNSTPVPTPKPRPPSPPPTSPPIPTSNSPKEEERNCTECSNIPHPWMQGQSMSCDDENAASLIQRKCNKNWAWRDAKYCQHTCFFSSYGYENDNCCAHSMPTRS